MFIAPLWFQFPHFPISPFLLSALVLLSASAASGQEALRNSLNEQSIVEAQRQQWENQPYNIKAGDLKMLIVPSVGLDYNDNIYISTSNPKSDWILKPLVDFTGVYPFTEHNVLSLSAGIGYDEYFQHGTRSDWDLKSGSGISFDIQVQDFQFNLHDRFNFSEDPSKYPELANVQSYSDFANTIGLSGLWDLGDFVPSLSYDHENNVVTTKRFDYQTSATELIVGRAGFRIHPKVVTGVEATSSFTTYDKPVLNNNTGYSVGGYAEWKPGAYLDVTPRFGYSSYLFQQTSRYIRAMDQNSWYADLQLTHRLTDRFSYSFDVGRETRLGIEADTVQAWYVRPSLNWTGIQDLTINTYLSFENDTRGRGQAANSSQKYDYISAGLSLRYPIMKKLSASMNYRISTRSSAQTNSGYTQNVVGIQLTYQL